jgi:hypothetical protein
MMQRHSTETDQAETPSKRRAHNGHTRLRIEASGLGTGCPVGPAMACSPKSARRRFVWLTGLVAMCVVAAEAPARGQESTRPDDTSRVRPVDPKAAAVLAEGQRRSPTVRTLLAAIDGSDLIVYVGTRFLARSGETEFVTRTPAARYLRISMNVTETETRLVPWLGHELRHAVEIASDPAIVSAPALESFYRSSGHAVSDHGYCTDAAQQVTGIVRQEMLLRPSQRPLAVDASTVLAALPDLQPQALPEHSGVFALRVDPKPRTGQDGNVVLRRRHRNAHGSAAEGLP